MSEADQAARWVAGDMTPEEAAVFATELERSDAAAAALAEALVFDAILREGSATVLDPTTHVGPASSARRGRPKRRSRRRRTPTRARGILVAGAALGLGLLVLALLARPDAPPSDAPIVIAASELTLERAGANRSARVGEALRAGDHLRAVGPAVLRYADGSELELRAGGDLSIVDAPGKRLALHRGSLRASVAPQPADLPLVVRGPTASATVLGTVFEVRAMAGPTVLAVERGRVELRRHADDRTLVVTAGRWADSDELALHEIPPPPATHHLELEHVVAATEADAAVRAGSALRPYRERLSGASDGACIALPGDGTTIDVPVPANGGPWWLWVRYRDEDTPDVGLPSFAIDLDGREVAAVTAPGGTRGWLWARCPVTIPAGSALRLRSTFAGELDTKDPAYAYRTVNRLDAVVLSADPAFDPRSP